jgi:hypothetical protein
MPRFDGTGPLGLGPGTGWGLGPCGAGLAWRRGWGRGFGWRRFWRFPWFFSYPERITKKEELEVLVEEAEALKEELKEINKRIAELKGQK